jgi:nucleoside-triphosphatase THEP1
LRAAEAPATVTDAGTVARRKVVFLTGLPGAGKTQGCQRLVEAARHKGLRVAGLITEARQLSSGRIVQTVLNLRTGERRRLAEYVGTDEGEPIGRGVAGRFSWTFVGDSVRWGRHELDRCLTGSKDLLVIDQLGPLELLAGSGWVNAVRVLQEGDYGLAVVVVNPLVVDQLKERLAGVDVREFETGEGAPEDLQERLLRLALDSRLSNAV